MKLRFASLATFACLYGSFFFLFAIALRMHDVFGFVVLPDLSGRSFACDFFCWL